VGVTNKAAKGRRVKLVNGLVQGYMEEWNAGIPKRAVEVNRKERKEHKDKGMWFIPLGFRLTRRVTAWLSAWVEKNSIFYAFFAFFAVKQLPNSRQFGSGTDWCRGIRKGGMAES
jgi:hypothetical protein